MFKLPVLAIGDVMDTLLLLRCQNLQRGIDELGSADVFLKKYNDYFGEDKTLSSNHLFKLLSGKIPTRTEMAREFDMVLRKSDNWLDTAPGADTSSQSFGAWPRAAAGAAYDRLPSETQRQLKTDTDDLVERWSTTDWRHVRVIAPDK